MHNKGPNSNSNSPFPFVPLPASLSHYTFILCMITTTIKIARRSCNCGVAIGRQPSAGKGQFRTCHIPTPPQQPKSAESYFLRSIGTVVASRPRMWVIKYQHESLIITKRDAHGAGTSPCPIKKAIQVRPKLFHLAQICKFGFFRGKNERSLVP
jgi:hypothetical protein